MAPTGTISIVPTEMPDPTTTVEAAPVALNQNSAKEAVGSIVPTDEPESAATVEPVPPPPATGTAEKSAEQSVTAQAAPLAHSSGVVYEPTTLEERILKADVIVRARLRSVSPSSRSFLEPFSNMTRYLSFVEFTFDVLETLKGNAGSTAVVELRARLYFDWSQGEIGFDSTAAEAVATGREWIDMGYDSQWDDREAILFLRSVSNSKTSFTDGRSSAVQFVFPGHLFNDAIVLAYDEFSIASDRNKVWLPATSSTSNAQTFYLDTPTSETPSPPSISLQSMKSAITTTNAMVDTSIPGYRECLQWKFFAERSKKPMLPQFMFDEQTEIDSGRPATTAIIDIAVGGSTEYWYYYVDGPNSDLFETETKDTDSDPLNGHRRTVNPVRPLPKGQYTIHLADRQEPMLPCNYVPPYRGRWTLNVVPPEGVLHELFFDPVTVDSAVAADGSNGVLKPASFTDANGGSAAIASISYESSTVKVEVTPDDALDDHIVDIIELDGTVSLSLDVADATVDSVNDTLNWSVSAQPWHDGDKLMVRIREVPPPPVFESSSYTFDVAEDAGNGTVVGTVSATDPAMDTVTYSITSGNGDGKFAIDDGTGEITVAAELDYESVPSYTLTVEASNEGGGSTTATVEISVTDVSPEDLPPAPEDLAVSLADGTFTITWSPLTGAARYEAQHHKVGSIDDWTSLPETTGTSATYSPTDGPACGTTYEFRVRAYGDGTTYVADWGAETSVESVTTSACNRAPAFGASTYSFTISENAAVNASVGTVSASDPDAGDTVRHTITAGNDAGKFTIASGTGAITVAGALDPDAKAFYALTVEASDGRGGVASARVGIALILTECKNGTVVPRPVQNPGLVRDCSMLLAARDTLAGDASLDWSADTRINDWQGVTVHSTPSPFVRVVLLTNLGLTGSIPAAFGGLEDVRRIDLDDNMLTGGIPRELGSLYDLELLYLFNNRITGELPAELGELSNLKTLSLSNNMLTGSIPTELGKLRNLRELLIEVNSLTGGIPAELGALPNLWSLYLSDNMLTGGIPAELGNLRKLRYFVLEGTSLGGEIPSQLGDLTRLEVVYLRNNGFTGAIPTKWGELSNLTHLYISSGNTFTGCIPSGLREVANNDLDGLGLPYCASGSQ